MINLFVKNPFLRTLFFISFFLISSFFFTSSVYAVQTAPCFVMSEGSYCSDKSIGQNSCSCWPTVEGQTCYQVEVWGPACSLGNFLNWKEWRCPAQQGACNVSSGFTIAGRIAEWTTTPGVWVAWQNSLAASCPFCGSDGSGTPSTCPKADNLRLEFYRANGTKIGDGWANECNPQPYYSLYAGDADTTWTAKVVGLPSDYICDYFTFGGNTYPDTNGDCQENIPNVNDSSGIWAFVKKGVAIEDNDWWQAINGGVHANGKININKIPSLDNLVFGRGLVSAVVPTINVSLGDYGEDGFNWGIDNLNKQMFGFRPDIFEMIQNSSEWTKITSNINSFSSKNSPMYFESALSLTINSVINYDENKIVAVIFSDASNKLIIRSNIYDVSADKDKSLVFLVNGDVEISSNVSNIDAIIYSTGRITVESAGINNDDPLNINGGLYGNEVVFKRDLKTVLDYRAKPATQVSQTVNAINNGNNNLNNGNNGGNNNSNFVATFPSEMSQPSIFWIVRD